MKALFVLTAAVLLTVGAGGTLAADKHLFYMHGCCIKDSNDPKIGAYKKIVQNLQDSGFRVAFEMRPAHVGDNDAAVQAYARNIADQVRALLAKGVAPENITVAGYSLGSMTALVASGHIGNPKVNIVLLAGCPVAPAIKVNIDYSTIKGRVLSVYDSKDEKFGPCKDLLPEGTTFKEVLLNSGKGHAVFRLSDEKHISLWKSPMLAWTTGN